LAQKIKNDGLLKVPKTANIFDALAAIAVSGTPIQRYTLAGYLDFKNTIPFPVVRQDSPDLMHNVRAVGFTLKNLADHFGGKVVGDADMVSLSLLTQFGPVSLATIMHFCHLCKSGKYKGETEHIQTQGINASFLNSWFAQYMEDKEAELIALHKSRVDGVIPDELRILALPEPDETDTRDYIESVAAYREEIERKKARIHALEYQAQKIRDGFYMPLYEEIMGEGVAFRVVKSGSLLTYLQPVLTFFCAKDTEDTEWMNEDIRKLLEPMGNNEKCHFLRKAIYNAEKTISEITGTPTKWLSIAYATDSTNIDPEKRKADPISYYQRSVRQIRHWTDQYYENIMPDTIKKGDFCLSKDQYIASNIVRYIETVTGRNPVWVEVTKAFRQIQNDEK
jgi:hypothetical protein